MTFSGENRDKGRRGESRFSMMLCFPLKKIRKLSPHSSFLFIVYLNREVHVRGWRSVTLVFSISQVLILAFAVFWWLLWFIHPAQTGFFSSCLNEHITAREIYNIYEISKYLSGLAETVKVGLINHVNNDNTRPEWRVSNLGHFFISNFLLSNIVQFTNNHTSLFSKIQVSVILSFGPALKMVFTQLDDPQQVKLSSRLRLSRGSDCDLEPN